METGETMVEIIRATAASSTPTSHVTTASGETHEGIKQYYIQKIEELQVDRNEETRIYSRDLLVFQLNVAEKSQNLRRLQAKRNELNAKGLFALSYYPIFNKFDSLFSSNVT